MEFEWNAETLPVADRIFSVPSFANEQLESIVGNVRQRQKILDLCIGFGNLARLLVEVGKEVHGVDISQDSLEYARKKVETSLLGTLNLVKGDVRSLDYINQFDAVTCVGSFGFPYKDKQRVVAGISNALKPGGIVAITGVEQNLQDSFDNLASNELWAALESGEFSFSPAEISVLEKYNILSLNSDGVDSSTSAYSLLRENGFARIRVEHLYHETVYSISAVKK